jgi:NAD(P)-dependent dehydrogenase (short-subunit alcohol dehydrogenase family)
MDLGLDGRVYLVTGGSRGLGFAAAQALVADGARVVLSAPHEGTASSAVARLAQNAAAAEPAAWVVADNADPATPLAQAEADALEYGLPHEAAALAKRSDFSAEGPALVYLITHAAYGGAKVGIADTSGSRLAEHRRAGWQAGSIPGHRQGGDGDRDRCAQVAARRARASVLLSRGQMPRPGRMDRDRRHGQHRPGGNDDADLQSGGSRSLVPGTETGQ